MSLRVAIQMDDIARINIRGDSSFALMLEAHRRAHRLFVYQPDSLAFMAGKPSKLTAYGDWLTPNDTDTAGKHITKHSSESLNLAEVDVVLMRQDPPFDMNYITATHLLETISDKVLVVNDPRGVRNAPEKMVTATHFAHLMPPTLISRDLTAMGEFRKRYKDVIVKPLYGGGGDGIFRIKPGDANLTSLVETLLRVHRSPLMIQQYLPAIAKGDKRVFLLDGKPLAAINRLPPSDDVRANLHVGGKAAPAEIDRHDNRIADAIGGFLRDNGLVFCGIDVIGGMLTEINSTSPTGLREIKSLTGKDYTPQIWDAIEAKL